MRDICILRGHEKPISSLTWHPIHSSLISTGSEDGSLHHYLLDEPHLPAGSVPTLAPYDTTDPSNTPAQVIHPAHRVPFAHNATIWSLDWHPLGHILASGSKDNFTRFWSRARPGETAYLKDRFHIGEEAAEAQGTWNRGFNRQKMHEEEEQEIQDEAEGLVDQKGATTQSLLPGIQGMPMPGGQPDGATGGSAPGLIPGIGAAPPPPPPGGMGGSMPPIDQNRLAAMFSSGQFPQGGPPPLPGFPHPPGMPGGPPGNINMPDLQKQFLSQGMQPPQNMPPMPPNLPSIPGFHGGGGNMPNDDFSSGIRKRGPLPSQNESLKDEQRRGNWTNSR